MSEVVERLRSMDRGRLAVGAGILLALLTALILAAFYFTRPNFEVLYGQLEPSESNAVVNALEQMDVPVELADNGTTIMVPASEVGRVRMALAGQGLPSSGGPGYELFDEQGSLGMTSFMQNVNRQRALQNELARTVESLDGVRAARVLLVLPEREAFARDITEPSASVTVALDEGADLNRDDAQAIRHLVAAAVPRLQPGQVTLVNSNRELLFADDQGESAAVQQASEQRTAIEQQIVGKIETMLAPYLGRENFEVQVAADIDLTRQVERQQVFNPDEQVVRSTQLIEEEESSQEPTGEDAVTVEQNLPQEEVDAQQGGLEASQSSRTEEVINYEISNRATEIVSEPGRVNRLSVAVLVNQNQEVSPEGEVSFSPRPQGEIEQIESLVRRAAGLDVEGRGDSIEVAQLPFQQVARDLAPVGPTGITRVVTDNFMTILGWIVVIVITALILIFGVRPVLDRVLPPRSSELESEFEEEAALGGIQQPALPSGEDISMPGVAPALGETDQYGVPTGGPQIVPRGGVDETLDQMIELRSVEGKVRASSLLKLSQIVDDNPDEVVAILRSWIYEDAA